VHSWFASSDEWDGQFESHSHGWASFFRVLGLYLGHFAGRYGPSFQVMGVTAEPKAAAWATLTGPLGLAGVAAG
uniref:hypothetical protein n=1 Tax=Klebsiella aerogenes TaxID=548 RepID=UPI001952E10E